MEMLLKVRKRNRVEHPKLSQLHTPEESRRQQKKKKQNNPLFASAYSHPTLMKLTKNPWTWSRQWNHSHKHIILTRDHCAADDDSSLPLETRKLTHSHHHQHQIYGWFRKFQWRVGIQRRFLLYFYETTLLKLTRRRFFERTSLTSKQQAACERDRERERDRESASAQESVESAREHAWFRPSHLKFLFSHITTRFVTISFE